MNEAGAASPAKAESYGESLRNSVPLASHGVWQATPDRRDPLAILRGLDAGRVPELVPIRYGRMLASPFSFYRGSAAVMAADLATTPATGLYVQACGDCHLLNFGGFATPERHIIFDINDFDETLPAPWEWDVKRLATSFVLAVRENGLPKKTDRAMAIECARAYRKSVRTFAKLGPFDLWYSKTGLGDVMEAVHDADRRGAVAERVKKATAAHGSEVVYPKVTEVVAGEIRVHEAPPLIFHPDMVRTPDFQLDVAAVLHGYRTSLSDERRVLLDRFRFVDAAIKVVGIGSVGTQTWIALFMSPENEPLFLQLKQALHSVLEPFAGAGRYAHAGERVVMGQRLMQAASDPLLGWTTGIGGEYYVRQLRDAKIKPSVETYDAKAFQVYARACAWNLARAHAKTGDARALRVYLGKSDAFDEAIGRFAVAYADQTERDYEELRAAVKAGKIVADTEGATKK